MNVLYVGPKATQSIIDHLNCKKNDNTTRSHNLLLLNHTTLVL